jgi:hypothetical protein
MCRVIIALALGSLISVVACGPEAFNMNSCVTVAQYDGPDFYPACVPVLHCGDGYCDAFQETSISCPDDCPAPPCGDGVCSEGEDLSCPDCETLPVCCCCGASCSTTQLNACECDLSPASWCDG